MEGGKNKQTKTKKQQTQKHTKRASSSGMMTLGYDNGWGDIFENLTEADLESRAVGSTMPGSEQKTQRRKKPHIDGEEKQEEEAPHFSVDAQIDAYAKAGFGEETHIAEALRSVLTDLSPLYISGSMFAAQIDKMVAAWIPRLRSDWKQGSLIFPMPSDKNTEIKSNLWVFMLSMRSLQRQCISTSEWHAFRSRIWLSRSKGFDSWSFGDRDNTSAYGPKPRLSSLETTPTADAVTATPESPWRIMTVDDCVYSGFQMGNLLQSTLRAARAENQHVDEVYVCPPFSTMTGLNRLVHKTTDRIPVTVSVGRLISYDQNERDLQRDLFRKDIAFCVRAKSKRAGRPWVVTTLYQVLRIVARYELYDVTKTDTYHDYEDDSNLNVFYKKPFAMRVHPTAIASVVFEHKVADAFSIPTESFVLGSTLRHVLEMACIESPCDLSGDNIEVAVAPWADVVSSIVEHADADTWSNRLLGICVRRSTVIDDRILKDLVVRVKEARIESMPMFCPMLRPFNACGDGLADLLKAASDGDYKKMLLANETTWTSDIDKDPKHAAKCLFPPYKTKMQTAIKAIADRGKGLRFVDVMGLSQAKKKGPRDP